MLIRRRRDRSLAPPRVLSVPADHAGWGYPRRAGTLPARGGLRRQHWRPGVQSGQQGPTGRREYLVTGLAVLTVELVQQPRGNARGWVAQRRSSLPTPARLWLMRNAQPAKTFPKIAIMGRE